MSMFILLDTFLLGLHNSILPSLLRGLLGDDGTLMPRPTALCFMQEPVSARGSAGSVVHWFVAHSGVSYVKGWLGDPPFPGRKTP